jgi:hypothetical protein
MKKTEAADLRPQGTTMKHVIDSYVWIEYSTGTRTGEQVKPIIEQTDEKITPTIGSSRNLCKNPFS